MNMPYNQWVKLILYLQTLWKAVKIEIVGLCLTTYNIFKKNIFIFYHNAWLARFYKTYIAPDKAAYCVFTQFRGPENAIKLISVRTKTL